MPSEHILIVDDEPAIQATLRGVLEDEGYRVTAVGSGADALRVVADESPDLTFLDIWVERMDGLETLAEIKRTRPDAIVVMISGHGTIETAVKATKLGAYDFIEKPLSLEKTLLIVTRALEHARLARENAALRESLAGRAEIIGESEPVRRLREQIVTAAPTTGRVLIRGQNGSGKELVARAVHARSPPREVRARRRRHALPGRNRRHEPEDAGEGAPGARGAGIRARRRQGHGADRRARDRGVQPRSRDADPRRALPGGPLLPSQRHPDRGARRGSASRD